MSRHDDATRMTRIFTSRDDDLRVDPERVDIGQSGIYVRAVTDDGVWVNADIAELTYDSLMLWLRSRGGDNPYAESCVAILLGHEQ